MEGTTQPTLPPRDGDAPLQELNRDQLSVFLYLAFGGEELLAILQELRVSLPGYRLERLPDVQRADTLADTILGDPATRKSVLAAMAKAYEFPALEAVALPKEIASELGALAYESDAPVRILWRLLADPSAEVRATAGAALDAYVKELYGPPPAKAGGKQEAAAPGGAEGEELQPAEGTQLAKVARRARAQAERAKSKVEDVKGQLKAARAELAQAQKAAADHRRVHERLQTELDRLKQSLREAKVSSLRTNLEAARKEAQEATGRIASLEEKAKAAAEERDRAEEELEALRRQMAAEPARAAAPQAQDSESVPELPSTWMFPRYTREFYDSLEGWDPRIQRTAFKQAALLAENHRHPSLRAIPLEGLPGYYRVRVATDVRLIYRYHEREIEILSLIDREDLDRYVRQAKTR